MNLVTVLDLQSLVIKKIKFRDLFIHLNLKIFVKKHSVPQTTIPLEIIKHNIVLSKNTLWCLSSHISTVSLRWSFNSFNVAELDDHQQRICFSIRKMWFPRFECDLISQIYRQSATKKKKRINCTLCWVSKVTSSMCLVWMTHQMLLNRIN